MEEAQKPQAEKGSLQTAQSLNPASAGKEFASERRLHSPPNQVCPEGKGLVLVPSPKVLTKVHTCGQTAPATICPGTINSLWFELHKYKINT